MIKFENTEVVGWEAAIRGMRNPLESWEKSDSYPGVGCFECGRIEREGHCYPAEHREECEKYKGYQIGPNDHDLMMRLRKAGTDHRKFMRFLDVYVDITAPLYWWKEFKTYRAGRKFGDDEPDIFPIPDEYLEFDIEMNSCSTMHKIHAKEFTLEDFSCEHLIPFWDSRREAPKDVLGRVISELNYCRVNYLKTKDKKYWWQMIQLLPSSYNQKRTVKLNYEVLANMYKSRTGHKLDEWREFCQWIEGLPYSEIITGFADKDHEKLVKGIGKILVTEYPTVEDFIDKWNSVCVGYPISKEAVEKLVDPTKRASEAAGTIHDIMDKLNSEGG